MNRLDNMYARRSTSSRELPSFGIGPTPLSKLHLRWALVGTCTEISK